MLAAELTRAQGIDVLALFFETPFFTSHKAKKSAQSLDIPFKVVNITNRHLEVVKRPKHGYGGNMNPCIDCHALMFRIAGEILEEEGASFVLTGEVLGQRPMSQNRKSLSLVAAESGLNGLLLRPLSAKHLPLTIPEEKEWVKRDLLMDFQGRSRKPQMEMAKKLKIKKYPAPAGGCLLTEKAFSRRLKDLLDCQDTPELRDIELLKLGRHFRIDSHIKLVVGRDKRENAAIRSLSNENDTILTSADVPGPTVLALGDFPDASLELAAAITAAYSDAIDGEAVSLRVIDGGEERMIMTSTPSKEEFRRYLI
jgi:tRNA U34 2-thiouridine synthase MnmA/TrmU